MFPLAILNLENGKHFNIKAENAGASNFYVRSIMLNGMAYSKSYFTYPAIMAGGVMQFNMGPVASSFGTTGFPATSIDDHLIVLSPVIEGGEASFRGRKDIRIYSGQPGVNFYYTTDGSRPTPLSKKFTAPFSIDTSMVIKAVAVNAKGEISYVTTASYKKAPHDWTIKLATKYESQYDGGGPEGLIDGITGSANWRKGNWQGYQKNDVDLQIDLKETKTISKVTAGFLQDSRAWIVCPKQLIVELSTDGNQFTRVFTGENFLPIEDLNVQVKNVLASFPPASARYVRVKAVQYGKLPAWHEGAGGDTHIFVDEINIE
jgi:hypothetical protein